MVDTTTRSLRILGKLDHFLASLLDFPFLPIIEESPSLRHRNPSTRRQVQDRQIRARPQQRREEGSCINSGCQKRRSWNGSKRELTRYLCFRYMQSFEFLADTERDCCFVVDPSRVENESFEFRRA